MAADPLLNRAFGAFEPVRRLSRPTDERPQEPRRDQKRKPHHPPEDSSPRNENGCDRRVRPHPPPRRSGGPPGCPHPGGLAPVFFRPACASRGSPDDAVEGHAAIAPPSIQ